ncbi:hypothetical protein D9619_008159 [Psilocybe cf. subviscida]|uniref:Uncharacterized protein n=1 Tax=Psilocybe cf. subviscida TaxID=2480587 RepID=A0A8H5ATM9_9AGAR|nr:hypothetical protein D9619_008159 [Psilocybe cf. subviscida]
MATPEKPKRGSWYPLSSSNKSPQTSKTMTLATTGFAASVSAQVSQASTPKPLTAGEQHWAARALRAEALLQVELQHKQEFRALGHDHDVKRERELASLAKEYKEKHVSMERLLIFLVVLIGVLVLLIMYLATHYTRHSLLMQQKSHDRWWSAIGASHFTIPILSPFTSVVEQETSVIGAKIIGSVAAIAACFGYFAFRHWLSNKGKGAPTILSRAIDR